MMKIKLLLASMIVGLVVLLLVPFTFAKSYPNYDGYVNDFAEVLSPEFEEQLETKLKEYEEKTTVELAVVTVKNLNGESVEEYSINLAEQWKVGKEKTDNGIIFLTSIDDRKTRIEVGYGLEERLTDIHSGRILDNVTPYYKEGKYEEGIGAGVNGIVSLLTNDQILDGIATASAEATTAGGAEVLIIIFIILLILFLVALSPFTPLGGEGEWGLTTFYGSSGGSSSGGGFGGGSFGGGGASRGW